MHPLRWLRLRSKPSLAGGFSDAPMEVAAEVRPPMAETAAYAAALRNVERVVGQPPSRGSPAARPGLPEPRFTTDGGPQGHRQRMREKLVERGPGALADYEVLEMILFFAQEKGDTKPLAKRLINRFGTFAEVVGASNEELLRVPQVGRVTLAAIKLVGAAALLLLRPEAGAAPLISDWDRLTDYLTAAMAHEKREHFRVLFLDARNALIADEVLGRGTVNHVPVYPREVIKRGLELHATAMILVHNHPSGDPKPSSEDVAMTQELRRVGEAMHLVVHDHIIVGRSGLVSFRDEGLL